MSNRTILVAAVLSVALCSAAGAVHDSTRQLRMTQSEILGLARIESGAGTSGLTGIETRVLKGDPRHAGLYTIQLKVPANTRIEAHSHPDDRVAADLCGRVLLCR